jgi:putative membrane protein
MRPPGDAPPGLQRERTALAWHRTALSLLAAAAGISRLTYPRLGAYALLCLGLVLPLVLLVLWQRRQLGPGGRGAGGAALSLTVITVILATTELVALLLR